MAKAFMFIAESFPGIPAVLGLTCALTLAIYSQVRRTRLHAKPDSKKV